MSKNPELFNQWHEQSAAALYDQLGLTFEDDLTTLMVMNREFNRIFRLCALGVKDGQDVGDIVPVADQQADIEAGDAIPQLEDTDILARLTVLKKHEPSVAEGEFDLQNMARTAITETGIEILQEM